MTTEIKKSARLRRVQWVAVSLLTIAGIVNYIDRGALSIANSSISTEMGFSPTQMGLLLSAFSLAYAFSQLPIGALLDRFGARVMLGAGMFFWSLAQMACGMVNGLTQFVTVRAVLGLGEAPQFPVGAKVVSEWFNVKERGRPTGMIVASSCIGPCIAPPLLTVMMLNFGWRWMFIATGIVGIAVALFWYIAYRNRNSVDLTPEEIAYLNEGATDTTEDKMTFAEWRGLFTHATTWGIIFGFMGVIYMVWLYLTWLPSYLEHARGFTVERTGWVVAIPYLFGTAGMLCAGVVADWLYKANFSLIASRKWPVSVGLVGGGIFTIPAAYTPNATMAVAYICIAMFFINLASAASWTMISVVVPKRKVGSLGSIMNFGGYFAGSLAPILTGFMLENTGSYVSALLTSAVVAIVAAVLFLALVRGELQTHKLVEAKA